MSQPSRHRQPADASTLSTDVRHKMKPTNLIRPAWGYLVAATPLASTCFLSWCFLEPESYKYIFGGLRSFFALSSTQLPQLMGILALIGFGIFVGSAFSARFHNITIQRIFSSAALLIYGFWGFQMTIWVVMRK